MDAVVFHRLLRADPLSVRRTLTDLRRTLAGVLRDDALARLELVLAEVLNNVVEHGIGESREVDAILDEQGAKGVARARAVHLTVRRGPQGVDCAITDNGVFLPRDCLAPRTMPPAEVLPEGGFGWCLIQRLVDDLRYRREDDRNCLAFVLREHDPVAA